MQSKPLYGIGPAMVALDAIREHECTERELREAVLARLCGIGRILPGESLLGEARERSERIE